MISCFLPRQSATATDLPVLETLCEWFLQSVSFHVKSLPFVHGFHRLSILWLASTLPFWCLDNMPCTSVSCWFVYPSTDNHCLGSSPNNEYCGSWVADVTATSHSSQKICVLLYKAVLQRRACWSLRRHRTGKIKREREREKLKFLLLLSIV